MLHATATATTSVALTTRWHTTQVYFGQYFFVMGIKYTDALSGSIWQNTIPIFTLFMGLVSGLEKVDMRPHGMAKLAGSRTKPLFAAPCLVYLLLRSGDIAANVPLGVGACRDCLFCKWSGSCRCDEQRNRQEREPGARKHLLRSPVLFRLRVLSASKKCPQSLSSSANDCLGCVRQSSATPAMLPARCRVLRRARV